MGRREFLFLVPLLALGGAGCSVALGIDGEYEDCTCGDGVVCSIEACDDGNTSDADRCSSTCVVREVVEVTAGYCHTCARLNDGSVKCWGCNEKGQLGLGDVLSRGDNLGEMGSKLDVVDLGEGRTAARIAAGDEHTCAILDNGNVTCWGNADDGRLGIESGSETVDLGFERRAVAIGAGVAHTCAILNDGKVKCWGRNVDGQLGTGDTMLSPSVDLGAGEKAVAIAVGGYHTCAILLAESVKCWGKNSAGQLGLGNTDEQPTPAGPVDLGAGKTADTLAAGRNHTCAILNDNSLKCWGLNLNGRLGLGDTMAQSSPTDPIDLGTGNVPAAITAGEAHTCAMLRDGSVHCWGYNNGGQVGVGDVTDRHSPASAVKLGGGKTVVAIAAGGYHNCAILNEGSLKCWGLNDAGQLGLGDVQRRGGDPSEMGDNLLTVKLFSDVW